MIVLKNSKKDSVHGLVHKWGINLILITSLAALIHNAVKLNFMFCNSRKEFSFYAELCFREFGDRVKHWVTFNEPNLMLHFAYTIGGFPPDRCSKPFGNCSSGDSMTEPFIAAHNIILSHALAANIYKTNYQVWNFIVNMVNYRIGLIISFAKIFNRLNKKVWLELWWLSLGLSHSET